MSKSKIVRVALLDRPTRLSGNPLAPGQSTKINGDLQITNLGTSKTYFVDRMQPRWKKKKKKKA